MKLKCSCPGAGHSGRNLLGDDARLAHAQDHNLALAARKQLYDPLDFILLQATRGLGYRFRLQTKKALNFGKVLFVSHSLPLIYDHARLLQVRQDESGGYRFSLHVISHSPLGFSPVTVGKPLKRGSAHASSFHHRVKARCEVQITFR
jgi:hypothetical protein